MVGEQSYAMQIQVRQNLRADADFALGFALRFGQAG